MHYFAQQLSNGIKTIHALDSSNVVYLGYIIYAGTRHENPDQHGAAHFVEHAVFKGTQQRKSHQIINRIENVGGDINAYTTKEYTMVYCMVMRQDYERALELLTDMVFNSVFPENEITREREVILDEINSYKDSPAELIYDEFEELVYSGHALGRSILGTEESLKNLNGKKLKQFVDENYTNDRIVFCSMGNIADAKAAKLIDKHIKPLPARTSGQIARLTPVYHNVTRRIGKDTYQTHCMMGNVAYSMHDKRKRALSVLNNLLGGPAMNSRLNMLLREKHGMAYNIESQYVAYSDTGLFVIYFGTDKQNLQKSQRLIMNELAKLQSKFLGERQLQRAKKQMLGQLAISQENREGIFSVIARNYLMHNKITDFNQIRQDIAQLQAEELYQVAQQIFAPDSLSSLIYE